MLSLCVRARVVCVRARLVCVLCVLCVCVLSVLSVRVLSVCVTPPTVSVVHVCARACALYFTLNCYTCGLCACLEQMMQYGQTKGTKTFGFTSTFHASITG